MPVPVVFAGAVALAIAVGGVLVLAAQLVEGEARSQRLLKLGLTLTLVCGTSAAFLLSAVLVALVGFDAEPGAVRLWALGAALVGLGPGAWLARRAVQALAPRAGFGGDGAAGRP